MNLASFESEEWQLETCVTRRNFFSQSRNKLIFGWGGLYLVFRSFYYVFFSGKRNRCLSASFRRRTSLLQHMLTKLLILHLLYKLKNITWYQGRSLVKIFKKLQKRKKKRSSLNNYILT